MDTTQIDGTEFEAFRPRLLSIAYRMLGSVAEAEDVVQEAWLRAQRDSETVVQSPRAYLTTIVTRLCVDHLRRAARTRTEYPGPWLPEPIAPPNQEPAELASSLSVAFLLLLEHLTPVERAVFLLREVFDFEFSEIAAMVGKSEANCRQILTRARAHLREPKKRFDVSRRESEAIVKRFRHATATGDLEGLVRLLDPQAEFVADGGGKVPAVSRPVVGAEAIARLLLGFARAVQWSEEDIELVTVNGAPGLVFRNAAVGDSVYAFDFADGVIRAIYVSRNPQKLAAFFRHTD